MSQEAKAQLLAMVEVLRQLDVERSGGHTAAADMAYLYAMTQIWCTVERNYKVGQLHETIVIVTGCSIQVCRHGPTPWPQLPS